MKKSLMVIINKNKVLARFVNDYKLRVIIFACISVAISIVYGLINIVVGAIEISVWYISLAGYYLLLAFLRGSVIISHRRDCLNERRGKEIVKQSILKLYGICGLVIILTIIALSFAIMQMVVSNKTFKYAGFMIYVGAIYTFVKVILAITNLVKAKKRKDLTEELIRNINIADAAVSILALQTAMFQSFSTGGNTAIANVSTGTVVCIFILFLGVFMIVKAIIEMRKLKEGCHGQSE